MGKRLTETGKWSDRWFRKLKPSEKLVFLYLIDNCNNAGFIELDYEHMAYLTGISDNEIPGAIKGLCRGCIEADGWLWIKNFLRHQKNESLNPQNFAHKQILSLIKEQEKRFSGIKEFDEFVGPIQALYRPLGIDKNSIGIDKRGIAKGESSQSNHDKPVVEEIYQAYPKKVGKKAALKAIVKALKSLDPETLLQKVKQYAECRRGQDSQFTPNPSTWFNEGRYDDDPDQWKTGQKQNGRGSVSETRAYNPLNPL